MAEWFREEELKDPFYRRIRASGISGLLRDSLETDEIDFNLIYDAYSVLVDKSADTDTGEAEASGREDFGEMFVDKRDMTETVGSGTDPNTGADLSQISKGGVLQLLIDLFRHDLAKYESAGLETGDNINSQK